MKMKIVAVCSGTREEFDAYVRWRVTGMDAAVVKRMEPGDVETSDMRFIFAAPLSVRGFEIAEFVEVGTYYERPDEREVKAVVRSRMRHS